MDTSQDQKKNESISIGSEGLSSGSGRFAEERAASTLEDPSNTMKFREDPVTLKGSPHDLTSLRKNATDNQVLLDRGGPHGPVDAQFLRAQVIKQVFRSGTNWHSDYRSHGPSVLTPTQKEALEMIAVKISRILEGDPRHIDHWTDLAGYAELVKLRMEGKEV